jgi:hypothetical protein
MGSDQTPVGLEQNRPVIHPGGIATNGLQDEQDLQDERPPKPNQFRGNR